MLYLIVLSAFVLFHLHFLVFGEDGEDSFRNLYICVHTHIREKPETILLILLSSATRGMAVLTLGRIGEDGED